MSGAVVWLTGLPASGKSTLAKRLRGQLPAPAIVLDSDEMRSVLEVDSYTDGDRDKFYRVLANLAATLARQGAIVLVPATAHRRSYRDLARELAPRFIEVWVRTPQAECARRDVKGLYARAQAGDINVLPGVGVEYEAPTRPDVIAEGGLDEHAARAIRALLESERAA